MFVSLVLPERTLNIHFKCSFSVHFKVSNSHWLNGWKQRKTADSDIVRIFFKIPYHQIKEIVRNLFLTHHLHIVFFEVVLFGALHLLRRTHLTHTRYLPDTLNTVKLFNLIPAQC